jgi:capsular exopolysaccharide synthesis family protein
MATAPETDAAPAGPISPPGGETGALSAAARHWRLILGLAIIGSIAAGLLCHTLTPLYTSQISLMLNPRQPKPTAAAVDPMSYLPPSEETVRKNEMAVLRSRGLAEAVISDLHLDQDPEFNPALRKPSLLARGKAFIARAMHDLGIGKRSSKAAEPSQDPVIGQFLGRLATTSTDASRIIQVRFSADEPEQAARIATSLVNHYNDLTSRQETAESAKTIEGLEAQIATLGQKVHTAERIVEKMRSSYGFLPAVNLKVLGDQITELNKQLLAATAERAAAEGRLTELEQARAEGRVDTLGAVLGSMLIQRLEADLAQLTAKESGMALIYSKNNAHMREIQAQVADLQSRIDMQVNKIAASFHNDVAAARAKETGLRETLKWTKQQLAKASESEVDVRVFEREAKRDNDLLSRLSARLNQTKAEVNYGAPAARVISPATVPASPAFPPTLPIMLVAFLASATGGAFLSMLLERQDTSIRSMGQLRRITTARLLGAVPKLGGRWRWRAAQSPASCVLAQPRSMFAENLRAVWFQLDHAAQGKAKTLLVTSAMPDEGKSSIAISLARLLAAKGRHVALVDADLRYPSIHQTLGLKRSPGLAELVAGSEPFKRVLQIDSASGATVIAAGEAKTPPLEVLQSPAIAQTLTELSEEFDSVIIDTPPVLAAQDAAILAQRAEATVMVVRWGTTRASAFITALQQLQDVDVPVRGVILSMVDQKKYSQYSSPDADMFSRAVRKYYSG